MRIFFFPGEGFNIEWIPSYFKDFNIIWFEVKMMD